MSAHGLLEVRPAVAGHIAECVCGRAFLRGRERDARESLDRHVRSFDRRVRVVRAYCVCGSWWTAPTKPQANQLLGKHLRERAREFRKLRRELRKREPATVPSEAGDQFVMEVPQ